MSRAQVATTDRLYDQETREGCVPGQQTEGVQRGVSRGEVEAGFRERHFGERKLARLQTEAHQVDQYTRGAADHVLIDPCDFFYYYVYACVCVCNTYTHVLRNKYARRAYAHRMYTVLSRMCLILRIQRARKNKKREIQGDKSIFPLCFLFCYYLFVTTCTI